MKVSAAARRSKQAPPWLLVASVTVLALTLTFLMALVLLSVFGRQVPSGSRFLVIFVLALGAGFGAAGLGGYAAVEGKLPFQHANSHPIAFSAGGGIAVMIIVLLLGRQLLPINDGPEEDLRVVSAGGNVVGDHPTRVQVDVRFRPLSLKHSRRLYLVLSGAATCAGAVFTAVVDSPQQGSMVVFLKRERAEVACARLQIEESPGVVAQYGPEARIQW